MSVYDTNRSVPLGSITTLRVVAVFERIHETYVAWRDARATEAALSKLSDLQLADIGLRRGGIADIAEQLARK